jgi:hypothetical protein
MNTVDKNLCGKNIYYRQKLFGKIVSDYDFESEEVKKKYGVYGDKGILLVEVKNPDSGWPVKASSEAYYILRAKRIAFAEDKFCWWLNKTEIKEKDYLLDERKIMDNE